MGFLRQAIKNFGGEKDYLNGASIEMIGTRRGRRIKTNEQLMNEYAGYVYRAIDVKATNVARVPLYTEQFVGGQWVKRDFPGIMPLLNGTDASPSQTWMRIGTTVYKQMFGEAFWYVNVLEQSRKPFDRLLLYPNRIRVLADDNGKVVGYIYTTEKGQQVPLDDDEVVHFKYFNPQNHLRGLGPLQAAGLYVDAERNTMEYIANFLENNATPSGIIVLPATTAEAQFNTFSENWKSRYQGVKNAGKTAILQADGVDFKQISSTLKDMQLNDLRAMSRDDILAIFGISKHIIGVADEGGLGRATAEAHEYIFAKHHVEVELADDINTLNEALRRYFPAESKTWRIGFTSPVPEDKEYQLNLANSGKNVMTLNERRALLGLGPVNGGDILTDENGSQLSSKTVGSIKIKKIVKKEITYEHKEKYRLSIQDKQTSYERRVKKIVKEFVTEQKEQVLDDLIGGQAKQVEKAITDGNLNPQKQAERLTELTIGVIYDLIKEQGNLAIKYAGDTEPFVMTEDIKTYTRRSLERASLSYNQDIVASIGKAVTEGLKNDESLLMIGQRIEKEYGDIAGYKLDRLVRTETLKASNEATQYGYMQLGITKQEWFTNPGACDYCEEVMKMGVKGVGETFLAKGESLTDSNGNERVYDYEDVEHPPLHANCRCVVLPVRE